MKKVLIISTPFFGYHESVGRAFSGLGYDIYIATYDEPIHPFKGLLKWQHKFARDREKLTVKSRQKYDIYIRSIYNQFQPDIVFSYNGTILLDGTLDFFRLKSKVVFWMYDSVLRDDREMCKKHIDHADAVFCFEKKDVEYYASINKKACFLPLACDHYVYYPIAETQKDIDILFVGNIYGNDKRIRILKMIVNRYPHLNILIYGAYKPYYKNPLKWLFREKKNIFKNINIPPEDVNKLYSRCRIALNIHHQQTIYGANQRVFEASGAGAYQICDANPFIESIFPNGTVGLYRTDEELITLIDDALQYDKSENARNAQNIVLSGHTFVHRVKEMLKIIGENVIQ
jgi:spore maturation protein CgeB